MRTPKTVAFVATATAPLFAMCTTTPCLEICVWDAERERWVDSDLGNDRSVYVATFARNDGAREDFGPPGEPVESVEYGNLTLRDWPIVRVETRGGAT